jgi:hypothetical protein
VGNVGRASSRAKPDLRSALALHRELNPVQGLPILVAIDQSNGQLFFTAAKGSCVARDRRAAESVADRVYVEWLLSRPSA